MIFFIKVILDSSYFQRIIYYLISMGVGILFDETALNKYKMMNGQQRKT